MMYKKTDAFTLIEILIVVAIIGVLSAVLIPNLLAARNRGYDTAARSYLREAVTMQEFEQVDNLNYTLDPIVLQNYGLKNIPTNVNFNIIAATAVNYCMSATNTKGSGTTFYATTGTGVSTTVCP